jgi:hypothetical protein
LKDRSSSSTLQATTIGRTAFACGSENSGTIAVPSGTRVQRPPQAPTVSHCVQAAHTCAACLSIDAGQRPCCHTKRRTCRDEGSASEAICTALCVSARAFSQPLHLCASDRCQQCIASSARIVNAGSMIDYQLTGAIGARLQRQLGVLLGEPTRQPRRS